MVDRKRNPISGNGKPSRAAFYCVIVLIGIIVVAAIAVLVLPMLPF